MKTTTKAKHTPGPWQIEFGGMEGDDYAVIGSKFADRAICNLEPRDYVPANARLIAAAPELLEALQELLRSYRDLLPERYLQDKGVATKARAAIAKATAE
jgi:hypothetical protein